MSDTHNNLHLFLNLQSRENRLLKNNTVLNMRQCTCNKEEEEEVEEEEEKKKKSFHPYDKWVATCAEIEEAAVGRKALIKAIADFMKAALPETTLTNKVPLPKIESFAQTTDILPTGRSPSSLVLPQTSYDSESLLVLPPTSYETETSPGIVGTSDDEDVAGGISEGDVQAFARKSFSKIASP